MREMGSATRALAERCLYETSCGPGHVIELGSNEAVKRAVEAGLGIGLLSTHTIAAERLAGLLVDLPVAGWACESVRSGLFGGEMKFFYPGRGGVSGTHPTIRLVIVVDHTCVAETASVG